MTGWRTSGVSGAPELPAQHRIRRHEARAEVVGGAQHARARGLGEVAEAGAVLARPRRAPTRARRPAAARRRARPARAIAASTSGTEARLKSRGRRRGCRSRSAPPAPSSRKRARYSRASNSAPRGRTTSPAQSTSARIASIDAAMRSSRGRSSPPRRSSSPRPEARDAVEAPRAALGVLPLAGDVAVGLERAQQRVHRVRVDRQRARGQRPDAVHQLVAVGRLLGDEVQHQQRQQPRPPQVADQRIGAAGTLRGRARAGRLGGGARRLDRGRLRRRLRRLAGGHGPGVSQGRPSQAALPHAAAGCGSSIRRGSSVSRAMTRRWICEVPS